MVATESVEVGPRRPDGWAVDALLVVVTVTVNVGGVLFFAVRNGNLDQLTAWGVALLLTGPGLLWWRRRWPSLVLFGCVAATWAYWFSANPIGPIYLPLIVALVGAVILGARVAAGLVVAGTLAVRLGALAVPGVDAPPLTATGALAAWLLFLVAVGELVRHRQALAEEQRRRLLMSLDARADHIRREAAEERLELAREVHDVVGHHLSIINIQATAGLQLYTTQRPGVPEALQVVQESSKRALEDVQTLLDALRRPDERAARLPSPTLSDLDGLLESTRAAGLDVHVEVTGDPRGLPATHDLAAGRVVLESLTNVLRHAGHPQTWVRVGYHPNQVTVRVDNNADTATNTPNHTRPGPGGGRGIPGMRARVATYGGTLTAGPEEPFAWSVRANIPIPKEHP